MGLGQRRRRGRGRLTSCAGLVLAQHPDLFLEHVLHIEHLHEDDRTTTVSGVEKITPPIPNKLAERICTERSSAGRERDRAALHEMA